MAKRGLKSRDVAKDHFSSGIVLDEPKFSRLIVRFIEGKDLLASDVETGKSDPVAFVWCGPSNENPILDDADMPESGILRTGVCRTTVNPIWNEDVIFPLDITDIKSFLQMKCMVYVRDEDLGEKDGLITYDELGMLELPFKDIFTKGKALKNSIVVSGTWYTLSKSPGMRKVDGSIKITLTMIFAAEDNDTITQQLPAVEQNPHLTRASLSHITSVSQRVQKYLTAPPGTAELPKDNKLRLSLIGLGRPTSAKASSRSSMASPNIAPMVRRPSTAPLKRLEEILPLEPAGRAQNRRNLRDGDGLDEEDEDDEEVDEDDEEEGEDGDSLKEAEKEGDEKEEEEDDEVARRFSGGSFNNRNGDGERETSKGGSKQGSQAGSRRGSEKNNEEELIVMSNTQYEQKNAASKQKSSNNGIAVEVGGHDLSELLGSREGDADSGAGSQAMQDIVQLGVERVTQALGEGALQVGSSSPRTAKVIAEKIRDTAHELVSGAGSVSGSQVSHKQQTDREENETSSFEKNPDHTAAADQNDSEDQHGLPHAGDQGMIEDVVRAGVNVVVDAVQNADIECMDVLHDAGKMVAKRVKGAASAANAAAGAVQKVANEQLKNVADMKLKPVGAGAAGVAVQKFGTEQVQTVGDDLFVPEAELKDGGRKEGVTPKNGRGGPMSMSGGGGARSPRRNNDSSSSPDKAAVAHVAGLINSSFAQPSGEEAFLHMMSSDLNDGPMRGDQALNPEEETPSPSASPTGKKRRAKSPKRAAAASSTAAEDPEYAPASSSSNALVPLETTAALSAATMSHLALQAELKQQAQGHATAVVRALKEMTSQRKIMEKSLEKIAQATAVGFSNLSDRISHLEEALLHGSSGQEHSNPLLLGPGEGDQNELPPEDTTTQRHSKRGLHDTAPPRIQNKNNTTTTGTASKSRANATVGSGMNAVKGGAPGRRAGATSASPPTRRPPSSAATREKNNNNNSSNSNGSAGDKYGNIGAIAAAKAQARAAKKKALHPPYATFEDAPAASSNSVSSGMYFQPTVQLKFHGADGRVATSQLAEPIPPDMMSPTLPAYPPQQQPQIQQQQQINTTATGRPYTGPYQGQQEVNGSMDFPYGINNNNNNSGSYNQQPQQQQLGNGNIPVSSMAFQSSAQQNMGQQAVKYPLNRDFSEVLERGSLEDIARLVESTAPRPEDLSASVRNRLYDAIATLLHQNSHTERCLIWVLALVRGPRSLLAEVVGHTVRDLKEALENVALEASKRGLLASLLKSQINR